MNNSDWISKEQDRIGKELKAYRDRGLKVCISSSFQTHSIPLLHLISKTAPDTDVLFLNTGYHFAETLEFRDEIAAELNLNIQDLKSAVPKHRQRGSSGLLHYAENPDYCCFLNKTLPMQDAMKFYDVWISGVRREQNANRQSMQTESKTPDGKLRYHPILDWTGKMIHQYRKAFHLPPHPLEAQGYLSIGCEPCTQKFNPEASREGRWAGMKKTECGLHTELIEK